MLHQGFARGGRAPSRSRRPGAAAATGRSAVREGHASGRGGAPVGGEFLAKQRHWLEVRRLPAYAPELNPLEGLWANLEGYELANRCETHLQRLTWVAQAGADRLRAARRLHLAFLRHAGLQL
jgi:transposase